MNDSRPPNSLGDSVTKPQYSIRPATLEDIPQIRLLIEVSVKALHTQHYTAAQIAGALTSIYGVDTQLILDGTYFVIVAPSPPTDPSETRQNEMVIAAGGWSYRNTLYGGNQYNARNDNFLDPAKDAARIRAFFVHPELTRKGIGGIVLRECEKRAKEAGFKRADLASTLSGVSFYKSKGYEEIERVQSELEDGLVVPFVRMGRSLG
jgi:GNAT superfamily N-acetyltransferase